MLPRDETAMLRYENLLTRNDSNHRQRNRGNNISYENCVDEQVAFGRKVAVACGKIILSGNISNAYGKRALAVPVDMHITATWEKLGDNKNKKLSITGIGQWSDGVWLATTLKIVQLIESRIGQRLSGKLTVQSTLPLGKGMGSSTAIVVALSRCFLGNECKYDALEIENIINKNHSGVDFAAIWEERPIVITNGRYEFVDLPNQLRHCFLVDTGIPSEPTSIILQGIKERYLHEKVLQDSLEAIGNCTERLLSGENPLTVFPDHNRSQVRLGVVPPSVRSLIERIERSGGAAKATRSGGNSGGVGMVVAVHPDLNRLKRIVGKSLISLTYDPLCHRFLSLSAKARRTNSKSISTVHPTL